MKILRKALAGTLESSDIMVTVEPSEEGIEIDLRSAVEAQYGDSIRAAIRETLELFGVEQARIWADDHGALDCTIRARVETAVKRAGREEEPA